MSARLGIDHARIARFVLGAYLCVHFGALVPYAAELFSSQGMLADASASPFFGHIPNLLFTHDSPATAVALLLIATGLAACFAFGVVDRSAALLLWATWAMLFTRNPLIANPSIPFIGLLLLAHALLTPPLALNADPTARYRLTTSYGLIFVVMALGYSYGGFVKLTSPSWLDGSALRHVLENPLARPTGLRSWLLQTPDSVLRVASHGVLALELMFAPLCLSRRLRPWLWAAMVAMHLGILVLVDFADLTLGMLIVHVYTFDPAWLAARAMPSRMLALASSASPQPSILTHLSGSRSL